MNTELQAIFNYMEKERGIDRETLIQAVEYALQSAAKKNLKTPSDVRIQIDRETCDIKAYANAEVVDRQETKDREISLFKARRIRPEAKVGDMLEVEVTPKDFGRIAAQTAKQAIIQKIRQAERGIVFEEYKDRVGDIVSGAVRQFNRNDIIVDLGRAEGVIPFNERVPTEEFQIGDRIRAYVLAVRNDVAGPNIILSRSHPDFVKALFRLEVSEIADGIVEIKAIAREAGYRTKIAVISKDEKVDPVGACVGMRGMRVKNIVRELSGEKIDIIRWSSDIRTYVTNALSPAKLAKVTIDPDLPDMLHVIADPEQLSLAIGKRGQNVRLSAKLIGWKIDIQKIESAVSFEEKVARAVEVLARVPGIAKEDAEALVKAGFLTVEGILASEPKDIAEMAGFDTAKAEAVYQAAVATQPDVEEGPEPR
jgi:N utilization substance protein A